MFPRPLVSLHGERMFFYIYMAEKLQAPEQGWQSICAAYQKLP
jgi:hypothetical protein